MSSFSVLRLLCFGLILLSPQAVANFDFGGSGECSGSGSFQQDIAYRASREVGEIPTGKIDIRIELRSPQDVDIQLFDGIDGTSIVQWQFGILNGPSKASTSYRGMQIEWSGYNGDGTGLGNEYIRITGATTRPLLMKAYGYVAGQATVDYTWDGTENCADGPAQSGSGSFEQYIARNAEVTIGDLPAGITDIEINLTAQNDIDVRLVDASTGTKIIHWPDGILSGAGRQTTSYAGLSIEYSGYNGDGTGLGNEYIKITGSLERTYTMSAFGYGSGVATVDYVWGGSGAGGGDTGGGDSGGGNGDWDDYYAGALGKTGSALKAALNEIIDDHTTLSYSTVWDALKDTDQDPNNPNNVILLYKQTSQAKNTNGGGADEWNREHVWAKSHGDFGTAQGPGTDVHHLRPTDVTVNSARGNLDFDNGGSIVSEAPLCRRDGDSWEPPDAVKGDVARMMFYMAVRYEGGDGYPDLELVTYTGTSGPIHGDVDTLKQWHAQDPVSEFERSRNDKIFYNWQGNRNPFIDNPQWVEAIW